MKVIGIDPAPSKETVIYDGEKFIEKKAVELKKYLDEEVGKDTLICWDAPLTGGKPTNFNQKIEKYNPFYQRKIEQLINDKVKVKGISTMGYAGCSHWAITQHCFGLPLINDEFKPKIRTTFKLITSQNQLKELSSDKKYIVEVHPALAIWLWLKDDKEINWTYKKSSRGNKKILEDNSPKNKKKIFNDLAKKLFDELKTSPAVTMKDEKFQVTIFETKKPKDMTDDHLDAYIAWKLGDLWQNENEKVILVGNENTGAMLLPNVQDAEDLKDKLKQYK